ncbi:unnamed protein product [Tilletia controversa]|uniref:Kinesin-like protein unc-104 n=1 Tax=Tilletia controversa TaxID=13291 RepID=A0A8X7T0H3_9BASI|nr:hypothetical protein CF328_g1069 [Tilletia controversa]KAE8253994.1 hypothetical protein A4X06_0g1115 [Tilletia controversa]CAD6899738.1 unnamed protein product [Tilletia controversa]CAD6930840.1 unnamed protein product [Tilletia controversa]CAD6943880.1 unnamed protein product [Tilletia controversa]
MADSGNIKVVVRCRPMNSREKARGASHLIDVIDDHQLVLNPPQETGANGAKAAKKATMPFSFDRSYDENTEQRTLFEYVGVELLAHAFNGFNTCVFAYGQTGSGKSHSMVGYAEAKGLIPLTCSRLFDDINEKLEADPNLQISVEVSYIEIYNEKVRDLLNPKNKGNLKVREHPSLGPYVEDLSKLVVASFADIENLMDEGNKARTVAATNMNETSSRSHAVFTLVLSQRRQDTEMNLDTEKVSRISLVDLAGSERANSTGATGARLKEGANINRSLTTLGKVIAALATASMDPPKGSKKKANLDNFVPYRDSVLTWLLKDSLGGNSKTAMIAAISPADYEETLSTLRYADQAKKIKNKAVVNEDPNAKLIRELKEELDMLRSRVTGGGSMGDESEGTWDPTVPPEKQVVRYQTKTGEIKTVTKAELQDQLEQGEKIMQSLNESWEEKLQKTNEIQKEREKALEELGITVDKGNVGVHTPKQMPHLVNLNEDPLMSECLIYQIKPGRTTVGNVDGIEGAAQIRLSGTNILPEHCFIENTDGVVTLHAMANSMTMVNGKRVAPDEPRRLRSGYRVILGDFHVFRFNHPEEVRKARDRVKSTLALSSGEGGLDVTGTDSPLTRPDSPASADAADVDWTYARREAAMARLNGQDVDFDKLGEEDLDKLFDDISRARSKRVGTGSVRAESRMSFWDDGASESTTSNFRPYSLSAFTDDTSVDPWSQGGSSEAGLPRLNGAPFTPNSDEPETAKESALRQKVKEYEERFSRIVAMTPGLSATGLELPANFSEEQKRLLIWTLGRWKKLTKVSMAEDVLSNAVLLKEANVISKELNKQITYQFTVVDKEPLSNPTSGVEAIAGLSDVEDVADPELANAPKPCVAVKVLDHLHNSVYVWSVAKLEQRLQKMRNLYAFIDRPEYSQHFNWADPFYEDPPPTYTFIGAALAPLNPVSRQISSKFRAPIICRHTGARLGSCSVEIKFISSSSGSSSTTTSVPEDSVTPTATPTKANGKANGTNGAKKAANGKSVASRLNGAAKHSRAPSVSSTATTATITASELAPGTKLGLQIIVGDVKGLSNEQFQLVHLQIRMSSIAGPSLPSTDAFTSSPADMAGENALAEIKLKRTASFVLTHQTIEYMRSNPVPIEFHAVVLPAYLQRIENFDYAAESGDASPANGGPQASKPKLQRSETSGRLAETEMISQEHHEVLASVQLCELNASGQYQPVQVRAQSGLDPGAFYLRQGLQRKLVLSLSHDSGRQFKWTKVTKLQFSEIRLLDPKGRIHTSASADPVELQFSNRQQTIDFLANGTSELTLWSFWDSSVHDNVFLNRPTASGQRVLVRLTFGVNVESCAKPVEFGMDIALTINTRDARPPGRLLSLIDSATNGTRTLSRTTALFSIKLTPPLTKRTNELWRLDTGTKYVRGEEALDRWRPRGVTLVREHLRTTQKQALRAEVDGVRTLLKNKPPLALQNGSDGSSRDESALLEKALAFWQRSVSDAKMQDLKSSEESIEAPVAAQPVAPQPKASAPKEPTKLTAEVTLVPRTDIAAKRGWLGMPIEVFTDQWTRRWFVLRRPYLYVYESSSEMDEVMVISLRSVRVEQDANIERMLERDNVFGLYTSSNSYFLQAPNEQEKELWMRALDNRPRNTT